MSVAQKGTIDWHNEALAVIKDVKGHVKTIAISEKLITGLEFQFFLYCLQSDTKEYF